MTKKNLISQVERLKDLKEKRNTLDQEIELIENSIKKEMEKKNLDTMTVGNNTIKYKTLIVNQFNTKAFKENYKDLYNRFVLPVVRTRFTLL